MPSDEAYEAVLAELTKLVDAWRVHREVINRAVNQLNHEVVGLIDRLDKNDADRGARQTQVDAALQSIQHGQDAIRRWQWMRVAVELLAIAVVAAFVIGRSL